MRKGWIILLFGLCVDFVLPCVSVLPNRLSGVSCSTLFVFRRLL